MNDNVLSHVFSGDTMSNEDMIEQILKERYYREGEHSWDDIINRVASFVSNNPEEYEKFYEIMINKRFIPNSPTLMNAGTEIGQLSACFVLPVEDSMEGIFDAIKWTAMIHKTGGGTGFTFSHLRPSGSKVASTDGVASGAVSFMTVFDAATNTVKQGGRRRGANMGILHIDHPEIEHFITCKKTEGILPNFNISVMITDQFMQNVIDYYENPLNGFDHNPSIIKAHTLFEKIIDNSWSNGEPGILFYDRINLNNPTPHLGNIEATNPCGEQPLLPFESCNLGSLDVSKYYIDTQDQEINWINKFDWIRFKKDIETAVIFLDNIIDKNKFPIEQIKTMTEKTRKIGLGIMGFADLLIKFNVTYGSSKSIYIAQTLMETLNNESHLISTKLGIQYGVFPEWKQSIWGLSDIPMRNAATTTIAPTGSISNIANCSSGIEPIFSFVYKRKNTVGKEFFIIHPFFHKKLEECCNSKNMQNEYKNVIDHCYENGTIQDIQWLPTSFKSTFKTSFDIPWKEHVTMQATFQKFCDASISKTINMNPTATKDDIKNAIIFAWKTGCKGLTIYRSGSRENEVLTLDKKENKQLSSTDLSNQISNQRKPFFDEETQEYRFLPKRPKHLPTFGRDKYRSGCGKLLIDASEMQGKPYELVSRYTTKSGGCKAMLETVDSLVGLCFRWGVPTWDVIKNLKAIRCDVAYEKFKRGEADGTSCANCIGRYLEENLPDDLEEIAYPFKQDNKNNKKHPKNNQTKQTSLCPDCKKNGINTPLAIEEGCRKCHICGFSQC